MVYSKRATLPVCFLSVLPLAVSQLMDPYSISYEVHLTAVVGSFNNYGESRASRSVLPHETLLLSLSEAVGLVTSTGDESNLVALRVLGSCRTSGRAAWKSACRIGSAPQAERNSCPSLHSNQPHTALRESVEPALVSHPSTPWRALNAVSAHTIPALKSVGSLTQVPSSRRERNGRGRILGGSLP